MKTPEEQLKIICKGIENLITKDELLEKLKESYYNNRPLIIKLGLDPSAPDIHLGHTVVLRKVRQMQDLGHKAVIIIGDFTGRIGDPTGKSKTRVALSEEQVKENAMTYCEQVFRVLDRTKTEIRYNSEWLSQLKFDKIIELAATTTVARMLERDDFYNRYQRQIPIGIHEFFYPLMQAYDSVEVKADIELGGTDQTFNILMGRQLQKYYGQEPQIALFVPLLVGLDGKEKMSKSLGNYIGVNEDAKIIFKKAMEIPDELIINYFELVTDEHPDRIKEIEKLLKDGANPRDIKLILAKTITSLYHSQEETEAAYLYYIEAFGKKAIPSDIPAIFIEQESIEVQRIIKLLIESNLINSKNEFVRLVKQGGIQVNGKKLDDAEKDLVLKSGDVLKIGKKKFARLKKRE